jgi:uncharacterized membrane protein
MYSETHLRSLIKTLSWRLCATVITIVLVFIFTGNIKIAAAVGGVEVIAKLLFYFIHERVWNKISLGKNVANKTMETDRQESL